MTSDLLPPEVKLTHTPNAILPWQTVKTVMNSFGAGGESMYISVLPDKAEDLFHLDMFMGGEEH